MQLNGYIEYLTGRPNVTGCTHTHVKFALPPCIFTAYLHDTTFPCGYPTSYPGSFRAKKRAFVRGWQLTWRM